MKTKAEKTKIIKPKRREEEERKKETRREETEKEGTKEEKNDGSKEDSRRMKDMGQRRGRSKKQVFFIGKKDGKKRIVQDYWYLNRWTIKNNYPFPIMYR